MADDFVEQRFGSDCVCEHGFGASIWDLSAPHPRRPGMARKLSDSAAALQALLGGFRVRAGATASSKPARDEPHDLGHDVGRSLVERCDDRSGARSRGRALRPKGSRRRRCGRWSAPRSWRRPRHGPRTSRRRARRRGCRGRARSSALAAPPSIERARPAFWKASTSRARNSDVSCCGQRPPGSSASVYAVAHKDAVAVEIGGGDRLAEAELRADRAQRRAAGPPSGRYTVEGALAQAASVERERRGRNSPPVTNQPRPRRHRHSPP